ncbi:hypothetical protein TW65_00051 [Stemphylium lycopersici]|nr:hypothetical protein TW65_00051 [Stemphylium lycopersici]
MRFQLSNLICISAVLLSTTCATSEVSKVPNANHVFNAIHSSMRQWGSSLNHNGMSFFLATVPPGTQLYHGTSKAEEIEGMEWLAFEPEHALIFARPHRGPPPGDGHGLPMGEKMGKHYPRPHHTNGNEEDVPDRRLLPLSSDESVPPPHHPHGPPPPPPPLHHEGPPPHESPALGHSSDPFTPHRRSAYPPHERRANSQQPLHSQGPERNNEHGYLHTYVPKHPLRLLYLDGLSAGKTPNGTLDTQDMLLLNITESGPMGGEYKRAQGMCNMSSTLWEGKIDGILRMEAGFEIILCDFQEHLERTDVVAVATEERHGGPPGWPGSWQYLKALTSRYNGIGGGRVSLDLEDFISVFAYPDIHGLFDNDVQSDYAMPRLQKVKEADRLRVKDDITDMILRKDWAEEKQSQDWQALVDMVVARYSEPLHYLHSAQEIREDKDALTAYLKTLLRPFIDDTSRNAKLETQRCIAQFIPTLPTTPQSAAPLAHLALYSVTHSICDTLLTALSIASSPTSHASFTSVYASHAVELVDELVKHLQWTTWKECGACADEEVCYIPIWPMGSHEDHKSPQCKREEDIKGRGGYWGSMNVGYHVKRKKSKGKGRGKREGKAWESL